MGWRYSLVSGVSDPIGFVLAKTSPFFGMIGGTFGFFPVMRSPSRSGAC